MDGHDSTRADTRAPLDARRESDDPPALPEDVLQAVTEQLVGRLVRMAPPGTAPGTLLPEPDEDEIDAFCDSLIVTDAMRSQDFFQDLRRRGTTPDTLSLRYIMPAAQRLGERWMNDECGFLDVTLGSARLHGLQRSLRSDFAPARLSPSSDLRALFTVTPGDTHLLGVTVAADFFRRAGWSVDVHSSPERETLLARASLTEYPLIGVSVGSYPEDGRLEDIVYRLRALQPAAKLVLGGGVQYVDPVLLERLSVDAVVDDVTNAPFWLQTLVNSNLSH